MPLQSLPAELKSNILNLAKVDDLYYLQKELCKFSLILCQRDWKLCVRAFFPRRVFELHLLYRCPTHENFDSIVCVCKGKSMDIMNSFDQMDLSEYFNNFWKVRTHAEVFGAPVDEAHTPDFRSSYEHLTANDDDVRYLQFLHPFYGHPIHGLNFLAQSMLLKVRAQHPYLTIDLDDDDPRPIKHFVLTGATCDEEAHPDWNDLDNGNEEVRFKIEDGHPL